MSMRWTMVYVAAIGAALLVVGAALSGIWWFCLGIAVFAVLGVLGYRSFPAEPRQVQQGGDGSVNYQAGRDLHLGE